MLSSTCGVQRDPVDVPDNIEVLKNVMHVASYLGELNFCVTIVT
jgi:hypothetical protein